MGTFPLRDLLHPLTRDILHHDSHLPDITLITPVFDEETHKIVFFTASRGHHSDIGGILPGSFIFSHLRIAVLMRLTHPFEI